MNAEEKKIENHLKELRRQRKLSQEDLAEALGITRQSIIALEQGRFMPSLPLAATICRFFDSAFEDMFEFGQEIEKEMDRMMGNNQNIINLPTRAQEDASSSKRCGVRKEHKMLNELGPWRPFREMVPLREAMDRLFEDSIITPKTGGGMPRIDIKDEKDSIVVKAELPGMTEDEVDVEIADGVMTISGQKKAEEEKEGEGYYYKESHSGTFSRSFTLPGEIKEEKAEADMKNGVLMISIPKIAPKKATKVKLSSKSADNRISK